MNIPEYISSGVVELYAAGALTPAEQAEFEHMVQQHPEIQVELDLINNTLNQYAEMHAVAPPVHLKSKILSAAIGQPNTEVKPEEKQPVLTVTSTDKTEPSLKEEGSTVRQLVPESYESNHSYKWLVAAAVSLFLISNVFSFYFYNKWKSTEQQLQVAQTSQQQFAQNYERVQQRLNTNAQALALLSNATTRRIPLKGVEKSPESEVTVFWHSETKKVLAEVNNLPAAPDGYQYQLWALDNGQPIDAGLLALDGDSVDLQPMKQIGEAQAFAVTLEPKGGSVNPNLEQLYVMGKI